MAAKRLTADQRRIKILDATVKVVAEKNYDRATMTAIARQAGINEALIYQHFKSKQELQLALLDYIWKELLQMTESVRVLQSPSLSSIRAFGRSYHRTISMDTDKLKCVIKAIIVDDERIQRKVWQIIEYFQKFIKEQLTRISEQGELDPALNKDMFAWVILSTTWTLSILAALRKSKEVPEEEVDEIVRYLERRLRPERMEKA